MSTVQKYRDMIAERIEALKERLKGIADTYTHDFRPLYQTVASIFAAAWHEFQRELGAEIKQRRNEHDKARRLYGTQQDPEYMVPASEARERFLQRLAEAELKRAGQNVVNIEKVRELKRRRKTTDESLRKQTFVMVGNPDVVVNVIRGWLQATLAIAGGVMATAATLGTEALTGQGLWAWATDPRMAKGLTIITTLGFTVITWAMIEYGMLYLQWRETQQVADEYRAENEVPVDWHPFSIQPHEKWLALISVSAFVIGTLLLFYSRVMIIRTMPEVDTMSTMAAACALIFVLVVYAVGKAFLGSPFPGYLAKEYVAIEEQLADIDDELDDLNDPRNHGEAHRDEVLNLVGEYNATMDALDKNYRDKAAVLNQKARELVDFFNAEAACYDALVVGFNEAINEMRHMAQVAHNLTAEEMRVSAEDAQFLAGLLRINRAEYNPEYVDSLLGNPFVPTVPPGVRIQNFAAEAARARRENATPRVTAGVAPAEERRMLGGNVDNILDAVIAEEQGR